MLSRRRRASPSRIVAIDCSSIATAFWGAILRAACSPIAMPTNKKTPQQRVCLVVVEEHVARRESARRHRAAKARCRKRALRIGAARARCDGRRAQAVAVGNQLMSAGLSPPIALVLRSSRARVRKASCVTWPTTSCLPIAPTSTASLEKLLPPSSWRARACRAHSSL